MNVKQRSLPILENQPTNIIPPAIPTMMQFAAEYLGNNHARLFTGNPIDQ